MSQPSASLTRSITVVPIDEHTRPRAVASAALQITDEPQHFVALTQGVMLQGTLADLRKLVTNLGVGLAAMEEKEAARAAAKGKVASRTGDFVGLERRLA